MLLRANKKVFQVSLFLFGFTFCLLVRDEFAQQDGSDNNDGDDDDGQDEKKVQLKVAYELLSKKQDLRRSPAKGESVVVVDKELRRSEKSDFEAATTSRSKMTEHVKNTVKKKSYNLRNYAFSKKCRTPFFCKILKYIVTNVTLQILPLGAAPIGDNPAQLTEEEGEERTLPELDLVGNNLNVLLLSSNPRSGSSYLADILTPNLTRSTYFFEPLRWYDLGACLKKNSIS